MAVWDACSQKGIPTPSMRTPTTPMEPHTGSSVPTRQRLSPSLHHCPLHHWHSSEASFTGISNTSNLLKNHGKSQQDKLHQLHHWVLHITVLTNLTSAKTIFGLDLFSALPSKETIVGPLSSLFTVRKITLVFCQELYNKWLMNQITRTGQREEEISKKTKRTNESSENMSYGGRAEFYVW